MEVDKSNICDLIINREIDIWNEVELQGGYFANGCIYLGKKEAIGSAIFEKSIGAVLTVMDLKSYQK